MMAAVAMATDSRVVVFQTGLCFASESKTIFSGSMRTQLFSDLSLKEIKNELTSLDYNCLIMITNMMCYVCLWVWYVLKRVMSSFSSPVRRNAAWF